MNIGILTFHRAINYGAVLQAYALQETLRSLGHEVWVIDYRQPRVERTDRRTYHSNDKINLLKGFHLRSWLNFDETKKRTLAIRERFDNFLHKHINLTKPCTQESIPSMDAYIIGSDQVWNSAICEGLDPVFWGNFKHEDTSIILSYAASTSVKDLQKQTKEKLQTYLNNFKYVSVREQATCNYLNETFKLGNEVQTVLDPTLLAEKNIWDCFDDKKYGNKEYVLYFGARSCKEYPTVLYDKAHSLAKKYGCEAISINFNEDTPEDFVNKFRHAKAIVTSSFHGVAFSIIFNRPLYAVLYGDEQDARYANVLKSVGAEDMLVTLNQDIIPKEYDYTIINQQINTVRNKSLNYIRQI